MRRNTRRLVAAGAGAALLTLAAPAAQARTVDAFTESFDETYLFTCEFDPETDEDDIDLSGHVTGVISVVLRERERGGPLYATASGHRTEVVTNTDTDVSWTVTARWNEKDLRVLSVDENSTTYLVGMIVHGTVFTPDGAVHSRGNARAEFILEVDDKGNGTFVENTKVVGQLGTDLCDDALALTVN